MSRDWPPEKNLPPMIAAVRLTGTLRNDQPVARLTLADLTEDIRTIDVEPLIALDLIHQLSTFLLQIAEPPLPLWGGPMNARTPDPEPAFIPEPVNAWDSPPPVEHYYWDQLDERIQYDAGVMWTWTIYYGTIDAPPGWFIVRPFLIERGGKEPVPYVGYMAGDLESAREPLMMMGLSPLGRNDEDPKGVVETWI